MGSSKHTFIYRRFDFVFRLGLALALVLGLLSLALVDHSLILQFGFCKLSAVVMGVDRCPAGFGIGS
jgi:hypothetical protein